MVLPCDLSNGMNYKKIKFFSDDDNAADDDNDDKNMRTKVYK